MACLPPKSMMEQVNAGKQRVDARRGTTVILDKMANDNAQDAKAFHSVHIGLALGGSFLVWQRSAPFLKRRWRGLWVPVFIHQLAKGLHGLGGFFGEVYIFISLVCHANNPVGMLGIHNGER